MKQTFKKLSESLFSQLASGEDLIIQFSGENSQFIR